MGLLGRLFIGAAKVFGRRHGSASPFGQGAENAAVRRQRQVDEEAKYFRKRLDIPLAEEVPDVPLAQEIDPRLERLIGKEITVSSSWISSLKWDLTSKSTSTVDLKLLNGAHYRYNGISLELFDEWSSPLASQGKFWWANIRGKFSPAQKINGATIKRPKSKRGRSLSYKRHTSPILVKRGARAPT